METTMAIDETKLAEIGPLKHGSHRGPTEGACIMEAVAYVTGDVWSDHPDCVCPTIGAFMRAWNDGLPDDETRTRLLAPLIPVIVNTAGGPELAERRSLMAADWLVRVHTVAWLRLAKLRYYVATGTSHRAVA